MNCKYCQSQKLIATYEKALVISANALEELKAYAELQRNQIQDQKQLINELKKLSDSRVKIRSLAQILFGTRK